MKSLSKIVFSFLTVAAVGLIFSVPVVSAQLDTGNVGLAVKVAPGELLPISTKLSNFGGEKRIDVFVEYSVIADTGDEISSASETMAVETTANLVKKVQIPFNTRPGIYIAKTSITYEGQLVSATTQFSFTVERKIFGLFQSDFFLYGGISILAGILMVWLGSSFVKHRRTTRFTPVDYSKISRKERFYYEILSDIIMQMRGRIGNDALDVASRIKGFEIDKETGRVLSLTDESPIKIITILLSEYERLLEEDK